MLTVDDDEFWEGVSPVEFGNLPALQDAVTVVGYPIGGDTISVTRGVVSRIEIQLYTHGSTELLGLQSMGNPDLRRFMGMKIDQKGVLIKKVFPTAPESKFLMPSDVILSFDGIDIATDGTVPLRHGERVGFSYLVSKKYSGDSAVIEVLRDFKTFKLDIKLGTDRRLVPWHSKGRPPSYYIIAGFVFTTVSVPYLRSEYGDYKYESEAPIKLLDKLWHALPQSEDEELVVVSQVLAADINCGYEHIVNTQVHTFNGKPVKNLKSLADMVESCDDKFLKFDLEYQQIVVLDTEKAKAATPDILTTNCIPSAMSDDLRIMQ